MEYKGIMKTFVMLLVLLFPLSALASGITAGPTFSSRRILFP